MALGVISVEQTRLSGSLHEVKHRDDRKMARVGCASFPGNCLWKASEKYMLMICRILDKLVTHGICLESAVVSPKPIFDGSQMFPQEHKGNTTNHMNEWLRFRIAQIATTERANKSAVTHKKCRVQKIMLQL